MTLPVPPSVRGASSSVRVMPARVTLPYGSVPGPAACRPPAVQRALVVVAAATATAAVTGATGAAEPAVEQGAHV